MSMRSFKWIGLLGLTISAILGISETSNAVPSFARQTNMPCASCHSIFPELNSFGRNFKLNGYTLNAGEVVESADKDGKTLMQFPKSPAVSAMMMASLSRVSKDIPQTQNNNIDFPQQFSIFLASQLTPEMGAFIQATYDDQGAAFSMDMLDLRYAHETTLGDKSLLIGLSLNNNPGAQDIWNTVPAWSFPFGSSPVAPTPSAAALIEGGLASDVAGLGPYFVWNKRIYAELSFYRSAPQGGSHPPDQNSQMTVKGLAPYWRLAYQRLSMNDYFEIGTYGLSAKLFPNGITGATDKYTDIAFDAQYERKFEKSSLSAHAFWILENQNLAATFGAGGSDYETNKLNTLKINGNYYLGQHLGFTLGYFAIIGDKDGILYGDNQTGKPDSNGLIGEVDWLPWLNTKFSIQYTLYQKFNGSGNNYDGSGRNASDNNTLYLLAWLAI